MRMLLYSSNDSGNTSRLQNHIESAIKSSASLEICRSLKALQQIFQTPGKEISVAILVVSNRNELLELQKMEKHFHDLRLILILPDNDKNTIELAHKLRPRFVASIHSALDAVGIVLQKMINSETNTLAQETSMA